MVGMILPEERGRVDYRLLDWRRENRHLMHYYAFTFYRNYIYFSSRNYSV